MNIKNSYVSSDGGLFGYDYMIRTQTVIDSNGQRTQGGYDSFRVSYIPEKKVIYYQFDLTGKFIPSDSVKKKRSDFIKLSPEDKESDRVYKILTKIREADLLDTAFNGTSYKYYTAPEKFKDSLGEPELQLFFLKKNKLRTPFNIGGRYPDPSGKICFAGFSLYVLSANRKLVSVISDIRPVTKEQENLFKLIQNQLPKKGD